MLVRLYILPIFFLLVFNSSAQTSVLTNEYSKILNKLSNKNAFFFVTNPVRFTDSTGQISSIKCIVELENTYMKKIAKKYGKKLIPDLINLLINDTNKDWAANLLLYSITNSSAVTLKSYNNEKIEEWRRIKKDCEIKKWQEYATVK